MAVIKNNSERATHYATGLKEHGTIAFEPAVSINYSESSAIAGLTQALTLSSEVVALFAQVASKEGHNIAKLSNYWVEKDNEMARGDNR